MAAEPFRFVRHGRSRAALLAWTVFDASLWVLGLVLVFTVPLLRDIWTGTSAGAELTENRLHWFSGRRSADVALAEIDHVRLVTRPDLSVRAAVVLTTGRKLRLPAEATPPHRSFEAAMAARGIRIERHHFTHL